MERCRTLEVNIISAENLEQVNLLSKMNVYAHVSVSADSKDGSRHEKPKQLVRTRPDRAGGCNPKWNSTFHFVVPYGAADDVVAGLSLRVLLRTGRALGGDRDVGEVTVPLSELLLASSSTADYDDHKSVSYQVRKPRRSENTNGAGTLNLSYKWSHQTRKVVEAPPVARNQEGEGGTGTAAAFLVMDCVTWGSIFLLA
ncbi:uncharacterized protein M6B38_259680 [Iris pallida]|uniref:C2 domain-containing protein n=1 Tax=Iris pallida TaxID=29817 RepID=A0AAX6IEW9_IRIPA|nr:uncharacterized protein M6B38_259680 [Iris pallida]